jgi:LuxR family transcriptional regulator, maltose regulon positive regulatory protein
LAPRLLEAGRQLPVLVSVLVALAAGVVMDRTQVCPSVEAAPGDAIGSPDPELMWTKLAAPAPRAGLLPRAGLQSLLQAGLEAKLCLLAAPVGFGKTTLLAQWGQAAGSRRVAWVSLEESDNDPTRFWSYLVAALRTVEPQVGTVALEALGGPSVELERVVVPSLVNDLITVGGPLVLVLDDYHVVVDATCHQTLGVFVDHLPAAVHVVLSTRLDPPLPLARMRAGGELAELRVGELQFTDEEAAELLNGSMGLALAAEDVARLAERTEGWAAGLVLAGLSLRGRQDPSGFIAAFSGGDRHVADYLVAEVLERQPEELQAFLLRTAVLERLSGPLCDAVLETRGSAALLHQLEASNLFVVPLDDRRQWYRYHQLFADLLRLQLGAREPGLVPVLHRRAAAWHQAAGQIDEAIGHASAAGEFRLAGALIAQHWLTYWRRGQRATVARWLQGLPQEAIVADPAVAFVAAWIGGFESASKQQTEDWLAAVEDQAWEGGLPEGISSLVFGAALTRAALVFDDVGRALWAAGRALELAGPEPSPFHWMAQAALGQARYLSGQAAEVRAPLEALVQRVSPIDQPYAVVDALAVLALLAGDQDDDQTATALAARAAETAKAQGLTTEPLSGIVHLALGRALLRQGKLAEAQERLEWALELFGIDAMAVHRAHGLLLLAAVRHAAGDLSGAGALLDQAGELVQQLTDPGMLPALVAQAQRPIRTAPRRQGQIAAPLTERELTVLRLLPTRLSTREIARELSVSVNTVRSQVQAIYRKLGVSSRAEAVTQARELGLLPKA